MRTIIITAVMVLACSYGYADTKYYVDQSTGKQVQDLSGAKTLNDINTAFHGNFTDVTASTTSTLQSNKAVSDQAKVDAELRAQTLEKMITERIEQDKAK